MKLCSSFDEALSDSVGSTGNKYRQEGARPRALYDINFGYRGI